MPDVVQKGDILFTYQHIGGLAFGEPGAVLHFEGLGSNDITIKAPLERIVNNSKMFWWPPEAEKKDEYIDSIKFNNAGTGGIDDQFQLRDKTEDHLMEKGFPLVSNIRLAPERNEWRLTAHLIFTTQYTPYLFGEFNACGGDYDVGSSSVIKDNGQMNMDMSTNFGVNSVRVSVFNNSLTLTVHAMTQELSYESSPPINFYDTMNLKGRTLVLNLTDQGLRVGDAAVAEDCSGVEYHGGTNPAYASQYALGGAIFIKNIIDSDEDFP